VLSCGALSSIPHIRHGFFGREGGVSEGLYDSLNCGYGSGDDLDKVTENRTRVCSALGTDAPLLTAFQVHSAKVVTVATPWQWKDSPEADALVTNQPNIPLGVLTADCLPVLFADTENRIIGAAHAGWKGAIGGVLEATLHAMRELGAENIIAAIGPSIAQDSYEVGAEFYQRFVEESPANASHFKSSANGGHYMFDLPGYAKARLVAAGIKNIHLLAEDTCAQEGRFFSYRRTCQRADKAYGRQVSVISL